MWSRASSRESTTLTAIVRLRNSVAVVGLGGLGEALRVVAEQVEAGPVHAHVDVERRRAVTRGSTTGAASRCTSSVSAALQTPGRCTLALTTIFTAMSGSAPAST